ncbi:MAG TPA: multiheme c-type cytochrome [Armatimonadota bacterium]|nr:multiheme c-type cytochrome [Armatimonadota bacterium]
MASDVSSRRVSPWLVGSGVLVALGAVFGVVLLHRPGPPEAAPVVRTIQPVSTAELVSFVGNQTCAPCHPNEFRGHAESQHARAMSRVEAATHGELFRQPSNVKDPTRGAVYRTGVEGGRCVLTATAEGRRAIAEAEWGFGSGKHGITYLGRQNGLDVELRLSYYPGPKRWAFSPGQQLNSKSGGLVMETGLNKAAETVEGCFVCHSTAIAKEKDRLLPETTIMGVGCESCHGPGKEHVAAMRRGDRTLHLQDLKSLSGQQLSQQLCGQCHRSPLGDDLNDPFNRGQLPRLQGLALAQSLCFTNSNGKLSCITCHDPHDQKPQSRGSYNSKCMSCHSGTSVEQRACPIEPQGDCVSCHMPAQPVGMPFNIKYANHWIKVWAGR